MLSFWIEPVLVMPGQIGVEKVPLSHSEVLEKMKKALKTSGFRTIKVCGTGENKACSNDFVVKNEKKA